MKDVAEVTELPPSPPWVGGINTAIIMFGFAWLLSYTLLDWGWQQSLGGWNYLIAVGLLPVSGGVMMRVWRPGPRA